MFTGLVEGTGTVVELKARGKDMRLTIQLPAALGELESGESVAVDGVCLTVVSVREGSFGVDVSQETLSRTTLGRRRPGDRVNLERALRLGERLGGHLVSGHVDGRARIVGRKRLGDSLVFKFELAPGLARYLIEKGSVAVNGVSLTVNRCDERGFEVNVIPHTARMTTMGDLRPADEVNIEVDIIGKYVEKFVRLSSKSDSRSRRGLDRDFLVRHGFI